MRLALPRPFRTSSVIGLDGRGRARLADTLTKPTLRAKGVLAFVAVVVYVVITGFVVGQERQRLLRIVDEMAHGHAQQELLAKTNTMVAHCIVKVQDRFYHPNPIPPLEGISLDIEAIQSGLRGLSEYHPKIAEDIERLNRNLAGLQAVPSRSRLMDLRESLEGLAGRLDDIARQVKERHRALSESYPVVYETTTLVVIIMGLLGAVAFGAVMTFFLTRLARDLHKLEVRAVEVVTGYAGAPLEVTRHDEVAGLMRAVNRMQSELHHREQQLEISRQRRYHQDKMAAIGSLAAAVAHEINNPIAAIRGIAQRMSRARQSYRCPDGEVSGCQPELILDQTKRIASITRQIAEFSRTHSPEPQLLDLNGLVRNTCTFIGYDKRFDGLDLALELDDDLPAINAVADHVTQVLMNLLINAADALEGVTGRKRTIHVATRAAEGGILMTVSDNGHGMDRAVLSHAFEESFTTKPPDKAGGLGLFLCKTLIEAGGGRIELESTPGTGTRAEVHLPLRHPKRAAA